MLRLVTVIGNTMRDIQKQLFELQDVQYRSFMAELIPTVSDDRFIGIRTPVLRSLAKKLSGTEAGMQFLNELPHEYFEENQLHAFMISAIRDYDQALQYVEAFLPHIDNWATCDQLSPAVFRKEAAQLLPYIDRWMQSPHTYTVRFAVGMLMQHFLDARFDPAYPERIAAIRSDEYYINMEIAWYFATALAKQPDAILPYLVQRRLPEWVHKKTIQKCIESRRIPDETKAYLRTLR